MTSMRFIRLTAAAMLTSLVAACGNSPERSGTVQFLRQLPQTFGIKKSEPVGMAPDQIARTLGATDRPVVLFNVEQRESQATLVQIEQNGPYRSFASSDRRVIVVRDGMLTSTRGFGGDLMSSDVEFLLELVSARQEGSAPYIQRYLTADNQTVTTRYNCFVTPGDSVAVQLGELNETGRIVAARCESTSGNRDMAFVVGHDGQILTARQWMGDLTGFVGVQVLRR